MFSISFKRLFYLSDKVIVRNLRGPRINPGPNPGLQKRLDAFHEDGLKIEDDDAEEFVEQSESDFYKVGESYNEHLNETLIGKYDLRHRIIKEKYFKENMPNMLTWSEKEQIRHLVTTQPDEWTPEKIAESFPVTVPVVKKLLKYPWKPASEQRIARHDESAMRNWRELKEGSIDIPQDLRNHFLKFSERTIPPLNKKSIKTDVTLEKNLGEFESIIKRCAAKEEKTEPDYKETNSAEVTVGSTENIQIVKKTDKKRVTLDELTAKVRKRLEKGKVNMPDQIMLDAVNTTVIENATAAEINKEIELFGEHNDENKLAVSKPKDNNVISIPDYSQRIRIPKKAYKKGATYKVNDCYYDHDGKFLYRVLGMSN